MSVNLQYVGFKAKAMVREYSFLVRESSIDPYEISVTILNEAFTSRRLSFQNAPDICSLKLHRELADSANNPLKTHYRITEAELDNYHESHSPKAAKGFYPRKPAQNL
ncbi:MAG TPA: hypothetical protein VHM88_13065 [Candidatus Acidoferrales bacterium]|nr:hypothetical protein [Candidatus Acidoferrales bacterium]